MAGHRTVDRIVEVVAEEYRIAPEVLLGPVRSRSISEARSICYWLAVELQPQTRMSKNEIARALGRDHSTVFHGNSRLTRERAKDAWMRQTSDRLLHQLKAESEVA